MILLLLLLLLFNGLVVRITLWIKAFILLDTGQMNRMRNKRKKACDGEERRRKKLAIVLTIDLALCP